LTSISDPVGGTPRHVVVLVVLGLFSFWSTSVLVRFASEAPALALLVWRTMIAVCCLLPFLRGRHLAVYRNMSWREAGRIGMAGFMLGLHFYLFFESLRHTTVASTTIFTALSPIFMAAIGFFFLQERLPPAAILGIVVATGGGAMIAWGDSSTGSAPNPALGNLLAIGASLTVSIYLIAGRVARQGLDWLTYMLPLYSVTAGTILIAALIVGVPLTGYSPRVYVIGAVLAVGPQVLGHGSLNLAVRYVSAAMLGVLSLTEPVGASALAFMLFDERPALLSLVGMGVALGGIVLAISPSLFRKSR
jgi:drug/metabolite transporter (DMT)-like permease